MSKIDLDFSSKINVECTAKDTFNLTLEVKNEDGSDYVFQPSGEIYSVGEYVLFSVLDFEKEPVLTCFSRNNTSNVPFHEENLIEDFYSPAIHYPLNTPDKIATRLYAERFAYAIANTLNTEKKFITGAFSGGSYINYKNNYLPITKNFKNFTSTSNETLSQSPEFTHNVLEPCIEILDGNIKINIQGYMFNLPEGSYEYSVKVLNDLSNVDVSYSNPVNAYFKNCKTWMHGKLTVKKF